MSESDNSTSDNTTSNNSTSDNTTSDNAVSNNAASSDNATSAQTDDNKIDSTEPEIELHPDMEPLTPEEMEQFLARARVQGRSLTSEEQYAIFGPPKEAEAPTAQYTDVEEMDPARLSESQIDALESNFFPELGSPDGSPRLVQGIIFDFDNTLAHLMRPLDELMEAGALQAEQYMRSTGMDFPDSFWQNIIEARRFAQEKSEEEMEEHIANDAMSFLLQFFGYPASQMDPDVLSRAVDIFYAPEMTAWTPAPNALDLLKQLHAEGYKLAILANYNCDRVFQRTIDYLGFRPYLDIVLASASVEYRKPDEQFFQIVLDRWDLLPYEVVVVGDSLIHDVKGALDLGAMTVQSLQLTTAQVEHDNAAVADEVTADAVITDLQELVEIVAAWSQ